MPESTGREKVAKDEDLLDRLADAQQQYDRYVQLAHIAGFTELIVTAQASTTEQNDVPLSLTIWPEE